VTKREGRAQSGSKSRSVKDRTKERSYEERRRLPGKTCADSGTKSSCGKKRPKSRGWSGINNSGSDAVLWEGGDRKAKMVTATSGSKRLNQGNLSTRNMEKTEKRWKKRQRREKPSQKRNYEACSTGRARYSLFGEMPRNNRADGINSKVAGETGGGKTKVKRKRKRRKNWEIRSKANQLRGKEKRNMCRDGNKTGKKTANLGSEKLTKAKK